MRRLSIILALGWVTACSGNGPAPGNDGANASNGTNIAENAATANEATSAATNMAAPVDSAANGLAMAPGGDPVATLPLKPGFYVSSDTPCGQASNATLQLLGKQGFGGSRDNCVFKSIEKIGPARYRVTEECSSGGEAWGTEEELSHSVTLYDIPDSKSYSATGDGGYKSSARYCPQSSLPEPWRDNDIGGL